MPCHAQGCCMLDSKPSLCSRPSLSLQDARLGTMGRAVNKLVSVLMAAPVTQP